MWPDPQETADLITFTGEILNRKLHFLCSVWCLGIVTGFAHERPNIKKSEKTHSEMQLQSGIWLKKLYPKLYAISELTVKIYFVHAE